MKIQKLLLEENDEPPSYETVRPLRTFSLTLHNEIQSFRQRHFPNATQENWDDWHWQLRNRITSISQLKKMFRLSECEYHEFRLQDAPMPVAITPYYARLIAPNDPKQAIRRAMIPVANELQFSPGEAADPLGEDGHSPVKGIVHRYPDRVLFLVTDYCRATVATAPVHEWSVDKKAA